jgi:hypothetical protein
LTVSESNGRVYSTMQFVATVAREGRIRIGKQEYDATLAQPHLVSGRFDRPYTSLFLKPVDPKEALHEEGFAGGMLAGTHWRDGRLYTTSATPLGDKLSVRPYGGDFGVLTIGAGSRHINTMGLHGSVESETLTIALTPDGSTRNQRQENTKYKVPVGDYYPLYLSIDYGRVSLQVSDNYHADGLPRSWDRPRNCFIKIRQERPFVLDFSHKPAVVFASPAKDATFKPGDEVSVKAVLVDPACDIMIRGLADTSRKKKETYKTSDGKEQSYEQPLSLDPIVTITDAAGKNVAQGPMPFG